MSLLDSVFSLIIAVSLGAFILAFTGRWPSWTYLLFWAAAGLTTLVKGPAGAIIIFAVAGAFLLIRRYNLTPNPSPRGRGEPSSPSPWEGVRGRFAIGILVFFAVALPWYVMVERGTHGAFLQEFIIHQNIQRALGKDFQHNGPFYYYIPIYLAGFFPWSVFIPLAWKKHVSRKPKDIPEEAALFFGVWAVCAFVVFSIFRSKLPHYILPVFVPSALIVGLLLSREIEKRSMKKCAVAVLVTSVLIGVALQVGQTFIPTPVPGLSFPLLIMSVAIIAGSIIAFALILAERFAAAFVALCAGVTAFLVVAFGLGLPAYASFASVPMVAIAQKLGRVVPENAAVVAYRLSPPQPAISFYAQHPVRMAATPEELDSIMASDKVEFIVGQNDRLQCLPSSAKQVTSAGKYILFRIAGRRD